MSDTYLREDGTTGLFPRAEGFEEETPPQIEREICPECHKPFVKGAGMTRHRRTKHGVGSPDRLTCKVEGCGHRVMKKNMGRHLREAHGINGGLSGKPRQKRKTPPVPQALTSEVDDLTPDQVVGTVVKMLWPDAMPTEYMALVMSYYGQTAEFLRKVRNGPRS